MNVWDLEAVRIIFVGNNQFINGQVAHLSSPAGSLITRNNNLHNLLHYYVSKVIILDLSTTSDSQ